MKTKIKNKIQNVNKNWCCFDIVYSIYSIQNIIVNYKFWIQIPKVYFKILFQNNKKIKPLRQLDKNFIL